MDPDPLAGKALSHTTLAIHEEQLIHDEHHVVARWRQFRLGRHYHGGLEGVVTGSFGAGVLGQIVPFQSYTVDDGSGEIRVVARSTKTPTRTGSRVKVKGQVNELAVFNGRSIGLHLQENDRKIKD